MQDKQTIAFTVTVTEEDWDVRLGGWRCPALKIPGAKVESVYAFSDRVDSSRYEVKYELDIIRWVHPERPPQATLQIKLTEELSTEEITLKWKKLAIILPLVTSILVALIAGVFSYISGRRAASTNNSNTVSLASTCGEKIRIIFPLENQTVPIPLRVTGTYQNLSQEQKIYVLVYSTDLARFYPQLNPVMEQSGNTWSCDVLVGLDRDKGRKFVINAVLANPVAQRELDIYIDRVKDTNDSRGLKRLPEGTAVCSFVNVQRE
jgi:hypothetical protein